MILVATLAPELRPFAGPLLPALGRAVFDLTGVRIPEAAWNLDDLPPYLRFFFRVIDAEGRPLGEGRDLAALQERFGPRARDAWAALPKGKYEKEGLTSFSFDALPEHVTLELGRERCLRIRR